MIFPLELSTKRAMLKLENILCFGTLKHCITYYVNTPLHTKNVYMYTILSEQFFFWGGALTLYVAIWVLASFTTDVGDTFRAVFSDSLSADIVNLFWA